MDTILHEQIYHSARSECVVNWHFLSQNNSSTRTSRTRTWLFLSSVGQSLFSHHYKV